MVADVVERPEWEIKDDRDPHRPWTVYRNGRMIDRFKDVWQAQSFVYRSQQAEQARAIGASA
jgi:hypothetical protein